jgi:translation initiation factor IF-3
VYVNFAGDKLKFTLRFLCKCQERRTTEKQVTERLLERLDALPEVEFFPEKKESK